MHELWRVCLKDAVSLTYVTPRTGKCHSANNESIPYVVRLWHLKPTDAVNVFAVSPTSWVTLGSHLKFLVAYSPLRWVGGRVGGIYLIALL